MEWALVGVFFAGIFIGYMMGSRPKDPHTYGIQMRDNGAEGIVRELSNINEKMEFLVKDTASIAGKIK